MNINDKINMLEYRIYDIENKLTEHIRILREDFENLAEGDEEVILSVTEDLKRILVVLKSEKEYLTNQL